MWALLEIVPLLALLSSWGFLRPITALTIPGRVDEQENSVGSTLPPGYISTE